MLHWHPLSLRTRDAPPNPAEVAASRYAATVARGSRRPTALCREREREGPCRPRHGLCGLCSCSWLCPPLLLLLAPAVAAPAPARRCSCSRPRPAHGQARRRGVRQRARGGVGGRGREQHTQEPELLQVRCQAFAVEVVVHLVGGGVHPQLEHLQRGATRGEPGREARHGEGRPAPGIRSSCLGSGLPPCPAPPDAPAPRAVQQQQQKGLPHGLTAATRLLRTALPPLQGPQQQQCCRRRGRGAGEGR
ncbi:hypothetical protein C2845_PM05G24150 [Panicum miliaceum]|uniref:Uncharacterized protein n=1 Tax=Panicum miliaceum TaxID=4540 RepID=A0A3L6SXM5_PANMI|nr:hypothetical protein C2845_PM05G24150 [Panicum miliaceum]